MNAAPTSKSLARAWLPPVLREAFNRAIGAHIAYRGPYASWDEARESTAGYDEARILQRVVDATQNVLLGKARYEQDGTLFHDEPPASHALAGLLLAASQDRGRLSVLDFGGGLGSHYLRWRPLLEALAEVRWAVVEQPGYVAEGNRIFASDSSVSFHEDVESVPWQPNVILASSVLQYLPDPYALLRDLAGVGSGVIVLDRTLFSVDGAEHIATQHVPKQIGKASYPVRMLSREKIHRLLAPAYEAVLEFESDDLPAQLGNRVARSLGGIWTRKPKRTPG